MNDQRATLQLMLTKGLGPVTLRRILNRLVQDSRSAHEFVEGISQYCAEYKLKESFITGIEDASEAAVILYERLENEDIHVFGIGSPYYPESIQEVLKDSAPPILYCNGNIELLSKDKKVAGFSGSRKASKKGLKLTAEIAKALVVEGIVVLSGYANGVDLIAHKSALEAGGETIIVLAEGIERFRCKSAIRPLLSNTNHLIISEFSPDLGWLARNAMQRNQTMIGLSNAMIIIESGLDGGTFEAAKSTHALQKPLHVVHYANPEPSAIGNQYIIDNFNGIKLQSNKDGKPNIDKLLQDILKTPVPVGATINESHIDVLG